MEQIRPLEDRTPVLVDRLLEIWESAVRATHDFLTEDDITSIRPEVVQGALHMRHLLGFFDTEDVLRGFIGVQDGTIEMLFVDAAARGQGIGKQLVTYAVTRLGAKSVDVNEQNGQAAGFYRRMGFEVKSRSALDAQGRPFPILHLGL